MDTIAKNILGIINKNPGIKARIIAKELGLDKKEVNQYLYYKLGDYCVRNDNYEWFLKDHAVTEKTVAVDSKTSSTKKRDTEKRKPNVIEVDPVETDNADELEDEIPILDYTEKKQDINDPLQRLCEYYLECLSREQSEGFEVWKTSKFDLEYREVNSWPNKKGLENSIDVDFLQKIMTSKNLYGYLGYPILVKNNGKKIAPILIWEIDKETGFVDFKQAPIVNMKVIKHYFPKGGESASSELLKLQRELGLENENLPSLATILKKLQQARNWQWNDTLDYNNLSSAEMATINNDGIFNKAVVFCVSKPHMTKGLIGELEKLSKLSIDDCQGTALYDWIKTEFKDTESEKDVIEVLPLNEQQKKSISKALTDKLTIITGPPGTGKSQVVINLIANQIYQGESVLFTSKNNKAVDVVVERANALSSMPFLIKLGGKAGTHELTEALEHLISVDGSESSSNDYERFKSLYDKYLDSIVEIDEEITRFVNYRNMADDLESKVCNLRKEYKQYFTRQKPINTADIKDCWNDLKVKKRAAIKDYQKLLDKFRWNSIKEEREKSLIDSAKTFNAVEDLFHVPETLGELLDTKLDEYDNTVNAILDNLDNIKKYIDNQDYLNKLNSFEYLTKEKQELRNDFYDISKKYFESWLKVNHSEISAKDKNKIVNYLTAVRLIGNNEDSEDVPDDVKKHFSQVQKVIPKYINAQAVTMLSAKGRVALEPGCIDLLIIDEASQCDIASAIPLLYRAKRVAIIGDLNQLPHVSTLSKNMEMYLCNKYSINDFSWLYSASSLFQLGQSRADSNKVVTLVEHHRSHADIIDFSNKEFYGGNLITATRYDRFVLPKNQHPGVKWIDVKGKVSRPPRGSAINQEEARRIVKEIIALAERGYSGTIGVIAPFRAQAECIKDYFISENKDIYEKLSNHNHLEINTVHQFQGDERDVMFFSPTITAEVAPRTKAFLQDNKNLFNVAITRARSLLITVGDLDYCKECDIKYLKNFAIHTCEKMTEYEHENDSLKESGANYPHVANMHQVSDWEVYFYKALYKAGVKTIPQYPVDKYKLDLALFTDEAKLDIEVDGKMYHKTWDGELCYRDQLRNQRMFEYGWDVLRFWVPDIRDNTERCVNEVIEWVKCHS